MSQLQTHADLLTIHPEVILSMLFSSGVDSHTGVPACITDQSTVERQHPATRQHLRGGQKQVRDQLRRHTNRAIKLCS